MTAPAEEELELALREMLRASQAYGRGVSDREQKQFSLAWDAAQSVLARTKDGAQSVI